MGHHNDKASSGETLRSTSEGRADALEEEYDLKSLEGGVEGKYFDRVQSGPNVVVLDPDKAG